MTFGIPLELYSDCQPAYKAEIVQKLMLHLVVKKLRTTGYNIKANGLCEKSNNIVIKYLIKYVFSMGGEWDLWTNDAAYAYNTSVHSSTGFSPAELMFGRKLRIPLDMYGIENSERLPFSVSGFEKKLQMMYELANESMDTRQNKYLSYYDKKVFDDPIKEQEFYRENNEINYL